MDVLVLGGTGFLSSAVVGELQAAGHAVTVFTRGERPLPEGVRALHGDRKDPATFARHFEGRAYDAVVDCICFTPEEARLALQAFGGRIQHYVMISTDFVYGRDRVLPIDESTGTKALNSYGRAKAASEELLIRAWHEEGFPATILRPPHIMGAGGHLGTGSLQGRDPALLDRLVRGGPVVLLDGGSLLIQPVVHRDIGRACCAALGKEPTLGNAYNVAGPDCITSREYYEIVAATVGAEEVEYLSFPAELYAQLQPEKTPFTLHRMYSVDRLAKDTGYRPGTTVRHAIFEMVDWLQEHDAALPYVPTEQDDSLAALCRAFDQEARKLLG